jgi:hypothetical protein
VAVALYVSVASVISLVAVLFAKETKSSSLRHDRVVRGAHGWRGLTSTTASLLA